MCFQMELTTPLDTALREHLRAVKPHQVEFAQALGRSAGWLNKYMHGAGNATIDDVVRMVALLIGVERLPLTGLERDVVKALRAVPEERREDAAIVMKTAARGYRHGRHPKSTAPTNHIPPATKHTAREKRRADGATRIPRKVAP
jgi:hypothetical protein